MGENTNSEAHESDEERLRGIVLQLVADIETGHTHDDVMTLLRERLDRAGVTVSEDRATAIGWRILQTRRSD